MIVDGKVRKMKFSERVRENFERFKDRIEGLGRKALIGGILIGGSVGCASNGVKEKTEPIDPSGELGEFMYEEAMHRRSEIYKGCITFEDSLRATERVWANLGPADTTFIFLAILDLATYPYKRILDSNKTRIQNK
jgi:hypothetical protein